MDRMTDDDSQLNLVLTTSRAWDREQADSGVDDDLPDPIDRRNRSGVCPDSNLKLDDDVYIGHEAHAARVIGPARGRLFFSGIHRDEDGMLSIGTYDVRYVTDRAPKDPAEEPMPVWLGDPPEAP